MGEIIQYHSIVSLLDKDGFGDPMRPQNVAETESAGELYEKKNAANARLAIN